MDSERTCRLVRANRTYHGKQGLDYGEAISKESVGSQAICMLLVTIPPGQRAQAHLHENHETAIYMLRGTSAMWYGDKLELHMELEEGDFLYIPAGMPHLPYNPSESETCTALIARTDPNEQESVLLLPELDALWRQQRLSEE
ncbi:cupin domain-containing protein [Paenibacillus sp. H1-7]|uniref:cupin domain-containing protein n=1 Tax=Paenibacillus sp. H1-7 TaxID=2282849 RepID=UPI001EF8C63E|nr:cupin domain-containing protein [Paenibacillus sp. H1-7]ULL16354.1 cupin domain-containing protein [Paenibacillus sp. H1-7]